MSFDPLLEPFDLGAVRLRNRVVGASGEPAFGEDGLPKDRYRLYHLEKARGGVGLTMIDGSAVVGPDSPPVFGNLQMYRDEIVPWIPRLSDDVHGAGAAVMIQLTHLGRRTSNYTGECQVAIAAHSARRRDLVGIVDWRLTQATQHGATFRFNSFAEPADILAAKPDVVIVATGGVPDTSCVPVGSNLVHDVWDVMTGGLQATGSALVYDDAGGYPALDAVEYLATHGATVHYVTPERTIGIEVGSMNSPAYLAMIETHDGSVRLAQRITEVKSLPDAGLAVLLAKEYSGLTETVSVDHVVVDHGTVPDADLYFDLKSASRNHGQVDYAALLAGCPQELSPNPEGPFRLFRIGDAVNSRDIHAGVLEALRLCRAF